MGFEDIEWDIYNIYIDMIYDIYIDMIYMYIIRTYHIFDILMITGDFDPISEDFFVPEFVIKALRKFRNVFFLRDF